jgi:hypothetical protein
MRVLICILILFFYHLLDAQDIWEGPMITFSKVRNGDPNLPQHQDRITDSVWITRADRGGIYNARKESSSDVFSPKGTRWAMGRTDNWEELSFSSWGELHLGRPPELTNKDLVLHLTDHDIYLDIRFTSWAQGTSEGSGSGGAFSYQRSTKLTNSRPISTMKATRIYPNPTDNQIHVHPNLDVHKCIVYSLEGKIVLQKNDFRSHIVELNSFPQGVYLVCLFNEKGQVIHKERLLLL